MAGIAARQAVFRRNSQRGKSQISGAEAKAGQRPRGQLERERFDGDDREAGAACDGALDRLDGVELELARRPPSDLVE